MSTPRFSVPRLLRKKTNTGTPGICETFIKAGPTWRAHRYYSVSCGKRQRRFNIDTLGRAGAWRQALRHRARYELAVRAAIAAHAAPIQNQ